MGIRTSGRQTRMAITLVAIAALCGCAERTTPGGSESPSAVATPATPDPGRPQVEDPFAGDVGSSTAAGTTLIVDGREERPERARCTRTLDGTTQRPIIRLTAENEHHQPLARVVLSDDERLFVLSAIVFRGEGAALTGVEGQDGSTLQALGDHSAFTVTGSVRHEADGTEHEMELRATCDLS